MAFRNLRKIKSSGFSLVETVIVIAIFVFVMVVMTSLFLSQNSLYKLFMAETAGSERARVSLNRIIDSVRQADRVEALHSFSGQNYSSDSDTLVLRLRSQDSTGDFIVTAFDYIAYYIDPTDSKVMIEQIDADGQSVRNSATRKLISNINSLEFIYDQAQPEDARNITISLVAAEQFRSDYTTTTLSSIVKIRNSSVQ